MSDREIQNRKIREIWVEIARHTAGSPSDPCPDAEILAAYCAQMLSDAEKERWEAHFSVCAACQEALVALTAAEENAPVSAAVTATVDDAAIEGKDQAQPIITLPRRPSRYTSLRWVIPAMAAVVVLAIWLGVQNTSFLRPEKTEMARNAPAIARDNDEKRANQQDSIAQGQTPEGQTQKPAPTVEQAEDPAASTHDQLQRVGPTLVPRNSPSNAQTFSRSPLAKPKPSPKLGAGGAGGSLASPGAIRPEPSTGSAAKPTAPIFPQRSPGSELRAPSISGERRTDQIRGTTSRSGEQREKSKRAEPPPLPPQARPVIPSEAESTAQIQTSGQSQNNKALNKNDAGSTAQVSGAYATQTPAPGLRTKPAIGTPLKLAKQEVGTKIFAPDRQTFWIIGPVGAIERSTDGGNSVITQSSGVLADLLAGSAPSTSVCWLVGRAGTILLTTDGAHWAKVGAPGGQDWIGVRAWDALHAVIWDKDQQNTFSTSDGGKTWTRINP